MIGTDRIVAHIQSEAEAEITSVLTEAEARASAITEEFAAKAKAAEDELLRAGKDAAEQRVQRQERTARLEAKKDVLGLKQELVSAAYDKAKKAILGMDEDKYVARPMPLSKNGDSPESSGSPTRPDPFPAGWCFGAGASRSTAPWTSCLR